MKRFIILAVPFLGAALIFGFASCNNNVGGDNSSTVSNGTEQSVTIRSGIYTENGTYFIGVDSDAAPASENGAW